MSNPNYVHAVSDTGVNKRTYSLKTLLVSGLTMHTLVSDDLYQTLTMIRFCRDHTLFRKASAPQNKNHSWICR